MIRSVLAVVAAGVLCGASAGALGQHLMITDRNFKKVLLADRADGLLTQFNFIVNEGPAGRYNFGSITEATQVGNEIWITDQTNGFIYRFTASLTPEYLSTITGVANARGLTVVGSEVYVASGTPNNLVVVFDFSGNVLRTLNLAARSDNPWDIAAIGADVLITDGTGDDLERYTTTGTWVSSLVNADGNTGISVPRQIQPMTGGGYVVGAFARSLHTAQAGVYLFDELGVQTDFVQATGGVSGVFPLDNGTIMFTEGSTTGGIRLWNRAEARVDNIVTGSNFMFIGTLDLALCGTSDFNGDGDFGTDQDIESFFACLGGNCCATCWQGGSDFNGDGDFGTDQDIESFFRVLGGGGC